MDNLDLKEKVWGGIFGIVAIVAAIAEMITSEVNLSSVFGMIKDVAGTAVVVIVMFAVAKLLKPKKYAVSFEDRLTNALDEWVKNNSNMIVKTAKMPTGHENDFGLSMKTDMTDFYNEISTTLRAGWFVRLPAITTKNYEKENIEINFHLNAETFFGRGHGMPDDQLKVEFDKLSKMFAQFINRKFAGFASAVGKVDTIKVILHTAIFTDEEIAMLVELINTTYTAYLVSSHIKVK